MTKDEEFLSNISVSQETINKINKLPSLLSRRALYLREFKFDFLNHLRKEYNLLHTVFPSAVIIPEARIKSQSSFYDKAVKVASSKSPKDIYDIFANRYIIKSINGSTDESDLIPVLYLIRDFLSYAFPNIKNIETRQKDYISAPKDSSYQALHMTRLHKGSFSYFSETQLQSGFMNDIAKNGAASHSSFYKKRIPGEVSVPILFDFVMDESGFCTKIVEKSFQQSFEDFFGIPFDHTLSSYLSNEK